MTEIVFDVWLDVLGLGCFKGNA